jgi:hypothetical protein
MVTNKPLIRALRNVFIAYGHIEHVLSKESRKHPLWQEAIASLLLVHGQYLAAPERSSVSSAAV